MAPVGEPLVAAQHDALRAVQRDWRRQFRDAQRAEREARLRVRRAKITDPPDVLLAVRRDYAAAQEAVEAAARELQAVQRELHEVALKRMTAIKVGQG